MAFADKLSCKASFKLSSESSWRFFVTDRHFGLGNDGLRTPSFPLDRKKVERDHDPHPNPLDGFEAPRGRPFNVPARSCGLRKSARPQAGRISRANGEKLCMVWN